jgi:hypothetical protein
MITERCKEIQQEGRRCSKPHCGIQQKQHIYGLYDVRLSDIFYVGSTFYPGQRFADHLKSARAPVGTKSLWLRDILESGSYPLPLLLYEFPTTCDNYTRHVERQIAKQLRLEGHTALCDDCLIPSEITAYMEKTFPRPISPNWWDLKQLGEDIQEKFQEDEQRYHSTWRARDELLKHLEEQWIVARSEQARVRSILKEMFEAA